jgi:hypothetical protein
VKSAAHVPKLPLTATMQPGVRKFGLFVHIVAAAYLAMDLIAQFVIVPFALASLLARNVL